MGIHLDLYKAGAATSKALAFDLPFLRSLLLVMLDTACSVAHAMENLIGHIEGAPTFNLQWPQFNRLCYLLVVKPNLEVFFRIPF